MERRAFISGITGGFLAARRASSVGAGFAAGFSSVTRAPLMFATLGFAALSSVPADMAPVFQGLHRWLDSWRGIGDLVTGMNRQAYDLSLTQYPDGGRCTFYTTGREHSLTSRTGSAWEKTAALAVQRAAARALDRMSRAE